MPNIDLSILNQRQTPAFFADTLANRPAPSFVGRIFISTDTLDLYRDTGSAWLLLSPSSTGTITGSGAAGQVTYFSGTSSITGSNDLFWDSVNGHLGIGTNVPTTALNIFHDQNQIIQLNQTTATNDTKIAFQNSGTPLWRIGNSYNAGANDYGIFDVVGAIQPFTIKKTTGQVLIGTSVVGSGRLVVANTNGDSHIQIVGASAPSLRIDSAESGPTKRVGLGISTSTNNFIQGSADRDFCIFNGSTTSSPILFGIYDTTNVQEAARISAARNFLIGTTTDSGEKLQVTGSGRLKLSADRNLSFKFDGQNTISSQSDSGAPESLRMYADTLRIFTSTTALGLTERLSISNSGNFGFNTGTALVPYHFAFRQGEGDPTTFTGERMRLQGNDNNGRSNFFTIISGSNAYGGYYVGDNGNAEIGKLRYYNLNNSWEFHTNNTLAMTISNAQNLLIGTTTDNGEKLQVNGRIQATGFKSFTGTKSIASGVTETIYTIPSGTSNDGLYFVQVEITTGSDIYLASGVITALAGNNQAFLTTFYDGANVTLSVSGLNIQVTNNGFATFTWNYSILFQPL